MLTYIYIILPDIGTYYCHSSSATQYNNNNNKLLRIDNQQLEISQKIERTNDLLSSNATASF